VSTEQLVGTIEKVESHSHDPTTEEQPDPWDAVTSEFGVLRDRLKDTYRRIADDSGPSEEEIKQAFAILLDAWDQIAASVTTAMKDPETRHHLKQALSSFSSAVGETISGLGEELRSSETERSPFHGEPGHETVAGQDL
jgi:hypothetical protein